MGGARALIASLGASISLMAGAALSLLIVSFVFAYPGITEGMDAPAPAVAFVLPESQAVVPARGASVRSDTAPVVITATKTAPRPVRRAEPRPGRAHTDTAAPNQPSFHPGVATFDPAASSTGKPSGPVPATGDGVREVGDAVSATVQHTGQSAGNAATQILGPPVSQAIQDVLDLLTSVVQGATGGLAGALDKLTTPR